MDLECIPSLHPSLNDSIHVLAITPGAQHVLEHKILGYPLLLLKPSADGTGRLPIHAAVYNDESNLNIELMIRIKNVSRKNIKKFLKSPIKGIHVDKDKKEVSFLELESIGEKQMKPLHAASMAGAIENVKLLISLGADIHSTCCLQRIKGSSALHTLCYQPQELRDEYACAGWTGTERFRQEMMRNLEIVRILCDAGADVNVRDQSGRSPLLCAVESELLDMVNLLVGEMGADVDFREEDGVDSLWGEPGIKDLVGYSPVMAAIQEGYTEIVRVLIQDYGANIKNNSRCKDKQGKTIPGTKKSATADANPEISALLTSLGACSQSRRYTELTDIAVTEATPVGSFVEMLVNNTEYNGQRGEIKWTNKKTKEKGRHVIQLENKKIKVKYEDLILLRPQVCSQAGVKMKCGACKSVSYCCKEHQKRDWNRHKATCKKIVAQRKSVEVQKMMYMEPKKTKKYHRGLQ